MSIHTTVLKIYMKNDPFHDFVFICFKKSRLWVVFKINEFELAKINLFLDSIFLLKKLKHQFIFISLVL
jgi:hypothetical protein